MKMISLKKLTDFKWLNLFSISYDHKGHIGNWIFASRDANLTLSSPLRTNAVVIVPIVNTPQGRKLLVIKEYRIPVRSYEYGFSAGLIDDGEDAEVAACRELLEETGLLVTKIISKSPPIVSSGGLSDETVEIVFVEAGGDISTAGLEQSEDIEASLLDFDNVVRLCDRTGEFENVLIAAKAWPILYMYKQLGAL